MHSSPASPNRQVCAGKGGEKGWEEEELLEQRLVFPVKWEEDIPGVSGSLQKTHI